MLPETPKKYAILYRDFFFGDEEKRLIGLVYRREGVEKAKELGYEIAWKKLQSLLERFRNLKRDYKNVVVYCWRGGTRKKS